MDKSVILNIVLIVLCAALYGLRLYFKTKGSVFEAASQFIAEIESSGLVGPEKMAYVVSRLFALIPIPLKSIFTESRLQEIAQEVFDTMKEYALRKNTGMAKLYTVLSMDPDIACYGPDAKDEPYYYSFEKDEPVRLQNAAIAEHVGFTPLRLEPDDPEQETDGTKLWFCVRNEICEIIEDPAA